MTLSSVLKRAGHEVTMRGALPDADVVCFSAVTGTHRWHIDVATWLGKQSNRPVIVMGGPHFTFFPEDAPSCADVVVQGPGEAVIANAASGAISGALLAPYPLLSTMPWPDREIQYSERPDLANAPMKRFIARRDCNHRCSYCFNSLYHQMYPATEREQVRPAEDLANEVRHVREQWGLELVYLNDDNICRDLEWLIDWYEENEELQLPWIGSAHPSSIDETMIDVLASSGCTFLNLAMESAVPATQKLLRRPQISIDKFEWIVHSLQQRGVRVRLQNMIGLPVDDPLEDAMATWEANKQIQPYDSWCAIWQPLPKTPLAKVALDRDMLIDGCSCDLFTAETVLDIECETAINNLHKWWYWSLRYGWSRELLEAALPIQLTAQDRTRLQNLRWETTDKEVYRG